MFGGSQWEWQYFLSWFFLYIFNSSWGSDGGAPIGVGVFVEGPLHRNNAKTTEIDVESVGLEVAFIQHSG